MFSDAKQFKVFIDNGPDNVRNFRDFISSNPSKAHAVAIVRLHAFSSNDKIFSSFWKGRKIFVRYARHDGISNSNDLDNSSSSNEQRQKYSQGQESCISYKSLQHHQVFMHWNHIQYEANIASSARERISVLMYRLVANIKRQFLT